MDDDTHQPHRKGKRTIAGQIAEGLRARILSGSLEPGAKLNLERLRQEYAVSLSSLREAIMRLSSDGLIEIEEQRGYRVSPISPGNLAEVTELRMKLEPLALRKAIRNGGLDWETNVMASLYRLNHTARDPKDQASIETWEIAHNAFHDALIARCDMPVLSTFYRTLMNMNDRYRRLFSRIHAEQRDLAQEHTAIAQAAVARDEDKAAKLLARHIEKTSAALQATLRDQLPQVSQ